MATTATTTTTPSSLTFFSSSVFSERQTLKPFLSFKPPTSLKSPSPKPLSITSELATLPVLSFVGEKVGKSYLDLKSAPTETARTVVHHGIITDLQNKRCGTASTLTREEINHKEKRLAISMAVESAVVNTIVVEDFEDKFKRPKMKKFMAALKQWEIDSKEKLMFLVMDLKENVVLSSRNIVTLKSLTSRTVNLFDILNVDKLVLTLGAMGYLNKRYGVDFEGDSDEDGRKNLQEKKKKKKERNCDNLFRILVNHV